MIGKTRDAVDFAPGLGDLIGLDDATRSFQSGDWLSGLLGLGVTAAGVTPLGDALTSMMRAAPAPDFLASRSASLYDLPDMPPRPFEADYPMGALTDDRGRLSFDIEGRPLEAHHVVGRTEAGGSDVALPGSAYDEIAEAATGRPVLAEQAGLPRGTVGAVSVNRWTGRPEKVSVDPRLSPKQFERVSAHEIGHVIDQLAGEIPTTGLSDEIKPLYNYLNTGQQRARHLTLPQHMGYRGDDIPRE